ncbi:hypothetical protein I4641_20715, partial [Waterburya agarophytonicola K14]|nr:hypothetical protein [Waterburya agarophytonicola KI4]
MTVIPSGNKLSFDDHRFWLSTIAGLLIAFNLCLVGYSSIYLLFWCAALSIAWRRRNQLKFESDLVSKLRRIYIALTKSPLFF